jgi:hypothetical protein
VNADRWPTIPLDAWQETHHGLHMRLQIAGKVRLACSPWLNHSWHATHYVTPRGLTTSSIPYGDRTFELAFDFIDHVLHVHASDGRSAAIALEAGSVASFHGRLLRGLAGLGIRVRIHDRPNEVETSVRFEDDTIERPYDADAVNRFWRALVQADRVLHEFRSRFIGKSSPVHFFWGAPDLAVTRFSGRRAPLHAGGVPNLPDRVAQEAYSHEVSSAGFWAGGGAVPHAAFYAYAYPEPDGYSSARVAPAAAYYSSDLREFVLPYDAVREAASPDDALLAFLESTYAAAAELGGWDRAALEWSAEHPQPVLPGG